MLIKILVEFDHVFKLHNIMKSQLHFKTSKTGPDIRELEGLIPGCILLLMGPWGAYKWGGGGGVIIGSLRYHSRDIF